MAGLVGVPSSFPGPSEVVIIADGSAPVDLAAVDVILQAEHGPGGLAWLISWDGDALDAICAEIEAQVAVALGGATSSRPSPRGYLVLVDSPEQAVAVSNTIAPEHLEIITEDPRGSLSLVRHAECRLLRPWSPASVGDYLAGPSRDPPHPPTAPPASAPRSRWRDFQKDVRAVTLDRAAVEQAAHRRRDRSGKGLAAHAGRSCAAWIGRRDRGGSQGAPGPATTWR
ncbi:MAG: histidinol dehydrogenase [Acidimicrobiales bacterium]